MTRIAAIVLAAGYSRRYGAENKLLADLNGKPVLTHVLDAIAPLPFSQRLVIVNPSHSEIASLCNSSVFNIVENENAENGMGGSIAAGVRSLGKTDAVMIVLGDMPFVTQQTYLKIIEAFRNNPGETIFAPAYQGHRGHPVIFRQSHFDQLKSLNEDTGAKRIIDANKLAFSSVPVCDPGIMSDIDAQSDLSDK